MRPVVRQIQLQDVVSFRECLDTVARERKYLAQFEAPPIEKVRSFIAESVAQNAAQYVAVSGSQVVGWCDIFPHWPAALRHVGTLGMGVLTEFRRQGLGRELILKTLQHALVNGIYRVTLEAREDNTQAIQLYHSVGFKQESLAPCALRFDGVFYSGVKMALLQGPAGEA